jgi:hypothetical protein
MAVLDDVKTSKGYILGVLAFATAVGAFLTQVLHLKTEPTLAGVALFALLILYMAWLIQQSEKRQEARLKAHEKEMEGKMAGYDGQLATIIDICKENQLSSLRTEMGNVIKRNPENHDTILKYAERYFIELGGDWVQTDAFFAWAEAEKEAGRPVHMPPALMNNIMSKREYEHKQ